MELVNRSLILTTFVNKLKNLYEKKGKAEWTDQGENREKQLRKWEKKQILNHKIIASEV